MNITISGKNFKQSFDKVDINIGSQRSCDFPLNFGFNFLLTIHFDSTSGNLLLLNPFNNSNFFINDSQLAQSYVITSPCIINIKNSDEYIMITPEMQNNTDINKDTEISAEDLKAIYGNDKNAQT